MTARRLRQKTNRTSNVSFMFHYPSELPHWWGRGTLALSRNAVIGRVLSQIIAMSQLVAFCRKASDGEAMGTRCEKKLNFTVPTPPRHFLYK